MPAKYPALAEVEDVAARVGEEFDDDETSRVEALLDSISIKVRRESGRLWLVLDTDGLTPVLPHRIDPAVPETIWDITVTAVERAVRNPGGFASESAGDYSYQRVGIPGGVGGVYLTEDEIATLREFRPSAGRGVAGLWTLSTTRNENYDDTIWMNDQFGGDPFPVGSRDEFPWQG